MNFAVWFDDEIDFKYSLGPESEPDRDSYTEQYKDVPIIPAKEKIYRALQSCVSAGLVKPGGMNATKGRNIQYMWEAAVEKQYCELTSLGHHYRKLVTLDLIP